MDDAKDLQDGHSLIYFQHIRTQVQLICSSITTVLSQYITRFIRLGREWYRTYVCTTRGLFFFCGWRSRRKVRDEKVIRHGGKIPGAQLARLALYVISVISGLCCSYLRWPSAADLRSTDLRAPCLHLALGHTGRCHTRYFIVCSLTRLLPQWINRTHVPAAHIWATWVVTIGQRLEHEPSVLV